MTSILKADTIQDTDGNNIINESSNTITIGASGDTISIPSGATIANSGTATGFGGITEADQWRLTANLTSDATPISSNLERVDDGSFGYIGTGMSVSSGVFTFPQTGYYLVTAQSSTQRTSTNDNTIDLDIQTTTNNSTYNDVVNIRTSGTTAPTNMVGFGQTIVDVTDTTNVKVRFAYVSSNSNALRGDTSQNETAFTFIRLGDT